jgi:transcriptional regulator with XRE-family HTH domain
MAEAPTLETLTPKQLGRHLRAVRRRKGLSQSEVARGAGLTRRELNAYEKGRIPIPDSDLFVLAGSCGVDVSELRVVPSTLELEAASATAFPAPASADQQMPSTIQDSVAQLRRGHDSLPPAGAVHGRRRARAIEAASEAATARVPEPTDDDWSVERIDPLEVVQWPSDESIASPAAFTAPSPAHPVDVFEELARLPEPAPLPHDAYAADPFAALPDFAAAPPPGAVEDVDALPYDEWPAFESDYEGEFEVDESDENAGEPVLVEMPYAQSAGADLTNAADAPPIDVAMRGESYASPWDSLQGTTGFDTPIDTPFGDDGQAPFAAPAEFTTDPDFAPDTADAWDSVLETPQAQPAPFDLPEPAPWTTDLVDDPTATNFDAGLATPAPFDPVTGPWAHEPDPEATNTGFYVDWGDPDADAQGTLESGPASWDLLAPPPVDGLDAALAEPAAFEPAAFEPAAFDVGTVDLETETEIQTPIEVANDFDVATVDHATFDVETVDVNDEEPPLISWRPQWDDSPESIGAVALAADEPPIPEPEPEPDEHFVVAGSEWVLGNAVPLVEVRSTGSLVMRRADERWALADVTAPSDFALEAFVDLRSGPGFGLLFRAVIDDDSRMSGYSFDVDPVYEGGSYLVREWRADRELWNPIARAPIADPDALHGLLAVRLTVDDERLVASINGEVVLEVESLKQASADRGREGAAGNRVGIQAWSSTDLVIDELRVAQR